MRRGTTLFALPTHTADGAKAIWGTADKIWNTLGDTSDDVNWYIEEYDGMEHVAERHRTWS